MYNPFRVLSERHRQNINRQQTKNILDNQNIFSNANNGVLYGTISKTAEGQGGEEDQDEISKAIGDVGGLAGSGSSVYSGVKGGGSGGPGWIGIAQGAMQGGEKFAETGDWKQGVGGMFGVDEENDSEIMQALKGTANGASMGASFGPWGALAGGLVGLGASFLDDF